MPPDFSELDDESLIQLTLEGQRSAFGAIIRRYQNRLFNSMVQILRSESDAEDVVQDAFVLAFTKLGSFKGKSRLYTWLYRIAYNVAVNQMRKKKPTVSIDHQPDSKSLDLPSVAEAPDARLQREERAQQLELALQRLSMEHRSILILREIDGMEYESISEILDLPIGTVRSRLHRARSQLREHLEELMHRRT